MANKIVQRLVAAGASPQKAQAFAQQFTKQVQTAQPSITKPKDIQDAFDAEIAAFAAAQYPGTFKPPTIDDPRINDYIKGAYGQQALDSITTKSFQFKAPDLYKILVSNPNLETTPDNQLGLDALIVKKVYIEQQPIGQLKNDLASGIYKDTTGKKTITGALLPSEYSGLVDKYAGQDAAQLEEETKLKTNFLTSDKYYKVGLPTPNVKYGKTEDLAAGIIDYKTHPSVAKYIAATPKPTKEQFPDRLVVPTSGRGISPIAAKAAQVPTGMAGVEAIEKPFKEATGQFQKFEDNLFDKFVKSGATPFMDEVKRRESLKKTTTLGK
jgi:hypothetical protein